MDENFLRQMQQKLAAELAAKEKEVLAYWLAELKQVVAKHHQDLAAQTAALGTLVGRLETRLKNIK